MKQQEKRKDKDLLLEKLRKDDSFFNDILLTQIDWIWEVNEDGIYTYCSEGVKDFLGYTPEEIIGKTPFDLMPPEEAKRVSAIYTEISEKQKPIVNLENWNLHKNGKLVCLFTNGIPFYDENGNWIGYRGIDKDITDRKEIEKNLYKSEEMYQAIFETAKDCIFIKNPSLQYIQVNPAMEKLFGLPAEELKNKTDIDLFGKVGGKNVMEIDRIVIKGETIEEESTKPVHGIPHIFDIIKVPLKDSNDNIFGLCGIARDITERKKVEDALKESEEKYRLISENANDLIVVVNQKFEIEYMNDPNYRKLIGFPREEIIGKSVTKFIHPDDLKRAVEAFRKGLTIGEGMEEIRFKQKNGNFNLLEIQGKTFIDSKGEKKALFIARDITEKKKNLEALRESEEKYRGIIETIHEGYFELDLKGNFLFINDRVCEFLGYSRDELLGMNYRRIIKSENVKQVFKYFNQVYRNEIQGKLFEIGVITKEEIEKFGECSVYLMRDFKGKKNGFYCFFRDITERKEAELKLKESENKYREAYNLANFYKDLFAHDMNNILQNILSSAALCELYLYEPEKLKDMSNLLKILKDQVKRGANLISNVRKLSQLEETQIITQSTEVYTILQKAIKFIQNSIQERKLKIKTDNHWKKIHIYANDLLIDVFENILFNAVKYNENPIIEIYIRLSKIQKERIKYLKIEFKDNGIGIQDSKKEIIFKRGYKKDISIKGMGFGLSLVKKILTGYNGEIWVEDRVKGDYTKGSNFVVLIPEAV